MNKTKTGEQPPFQQIPLFKDSVAETIQIIGSGEIGGKARGLIFLAEHAKELGYEVPKTIVLASGFFEGLTFEQETRSYGDGPCSTIRNPIFGAKEKQQLKQAAAQFDGLVALRSSASFEDADLSAAGICTTNFFDNSDRFPEADRLRGLEYFIGDVYSSAWGSDARALRKKHHLPEPKMSVIIQDLVSARFSFPQEFAPAVSGIVDTGYMNNVSLRFCNGFGTRAVRKGSANMAIYSKQLELLKRQNRLQAFDYWSVDGGRLELYESERHYIAEREQMGRNSARFVESGTDKKLAELALELSKRFGKPLELEFALLDPEGPAHLIQARPSKSPPPAPIFPEVQQDREVLHMWGGAISGTGTKQVTEIINTTDWCDAWGGNFSSLERFNETHKGYLLLLSTIATMSTSTRRVSYSQFYNAAAVIEFGTHMGVGLEHFSRICRDSDIFYVQVDGMDELHGQRFTDGAKELAPFIYRTKLNLVFDEEKGEALIYRE